MSQLCFAPCVHVHHAHDLHTAQDVCGMHTSVSNFFDSTVSPRQSRPNSFPTSSSRTCPDLQAQHVPDPEGLQGLPAREDTLQGSIQLNRVDDAERRECASSAKFSPDLGSFPKECLREERVGVQLPLALEAEVGESTSQVAADQTLGAAARMRSSGGVT